MGQASATPAKSKADSGRKVLVPDGPIMHVVTASPGWWATIEREDGSRTSVPIAMFALLTDDLDSPRIKAVTFDAREATFARYFATRKRTGDPPSNEPKP